MTATTRPPDDSPAKQHRRVRFSSLEVLGFTDVTSSWSDTPTTSPTNGRHLAPDPEPETLADWAPQEIGRRLGGSNIRWSVVVVIILAIGGIAGFGFFLYQRPVAIELAAEADVHAHANALSSALPALSGFNDQLLATDADTSAEMLDPVESAARALFDTSSRLNRVDLRTLASRAAGSSLDGVRLARATEAYRSAVMPLLGVPQLETDRELIEIDEAARQFGAWQQEFDQMRTALPDDVLPRVTEHLDVLSAELAAFLRRYVDALRADDMAAAEGVLSALGSKLDSAERSLVDSMADIQSRIEIRIDETQRALEGIRSEETSGS